MMQDPSLKPASLTAPPFIVRRTARQPGSLGVRITLHLHEAADPDKRTVQLSYNADLRAGVAARASLRQQRYEFLTQRVKYCGAGGGDASRRADAGRVAAAAAAVDEELAGGEAEGVKEEPGSIVAGTASAAAAAVQQAAAEPAVELDGSPKWLQQPKKPRLL